MKNFLVEESERIEILKRHKLVVEQQMPESYNKLMAGWKAGCFGQKGNDPYFGLIKTSNGDWVFQKTTGNQALKNQGLVILRIRPDGMYYNTDTKLTRFTTPQVRKQWVEKLRKDGYIVNPTDTEKDNYQYVELSKINYSGLPSGLFPTSQLVYLDPSKTDPTILQDKQENESMDRKGCKETIERFYNEFNRTKGRQITNRGLIQRMKDQAQFCKNEFEGKWGIGGGKFDEMIKVLSGRTNRGPSSSGDDSMFRLQ